MKTVYLIFWLANAIAISNFADNWKELAIVYVWNIVIPLLLLCARLAIIHGEIPKDKEPII